MSTHQIGQLDGLVSRPGPGPRGSQAAHTTARRWRKAKTQRGAGLLWLARWVLCASLSAVALPSAQAQDYAAAGQYFDAAQEAFQKGDFKRAAQQYAAAHAITKDSALLFSIGESWQRAGEPQKALDAYRAYLREQPTASERPEVEKRIKALEEALAPPTGAAGQTPPTGTGGPPPAAGQAPGPDAAGQAGQPGAAGTAPTGQAPTAPDAKTDAKPDAKTDAKTDAKPDTKTEAKPEAPPTITPPVGEKPTALRTAAWVGTAAAVALGTAGAIVGLGAQNRADELRRRTTLLIGNVPPLYDANQAEAYTTLMSEGQSYNTVSIALLSAAGVATVASVVLFILDFRMMAKRGQARAANKPSLAWVPAATENRLPLTPSPSRQPAVLAGSF